MVPYHPAIKLPVARDTPGELRTVGPPGGHTVPASIGTHVDRHRQGGADTDIVLADEAHGENCRKPSFLKPDEHRP